MSASRCQQRYTMFVNSVCLLPKSRFTWNIQSEAIWGICTRLFFVRWSLSGSCVLRFVTGKRWYVLWPSTVIIGLALNIRFGQIYMQDCGAGMEMRIKLCPWEKIELISSFVVAGLELKMG